MSMAQLRNKTLKLDCFWSGTPGLAPLAVRTSDWGSD